MEQAVNSQGVPVGPNGYVLCQICGKEEQGISREVTIDYAYCLQHRPSTTSPQLTKETETMAQATDKKKETKQEREGKAAHNYPIKAFIEQAEATQDLDVIRRWASHQKYSDTTISIQLGRLRKHKFLPPLEKKAKAEKKQAKGDKKAKKVRLVKKGKGTAVHAVPKPSQAATA